MTRRDELLELAAVMMAEHGLRATTVRDIADAAGILSGRLYHHFDSKESMVDEILTEFLGELFGRYREVTVSDLPAREQLRECVIASFEAIGKYPDAVAIYQTEARTLAQSERFGYIAERLDEFRGMWRDILTGGVASGAFRADLDIEITYRFLRDTVWVAVRWYRPDGPLSVRGVADQYLSILEQGIATRTPEDQ